MATKTCNQTFYTLTASLHCLLKKLLAVVCYAAVSFLWFSRVLFSLSICFFMNCCAILHDIIVFFRSIFVLVLLHCLFHAFVVIVYYIIKWKKTCHDRKIKIIIPPRHSLLFRRLQLEAQEFSGVRWPAWPPVCFDSELVFISLLREH